MDKAKLLLFCGWVNLEAARPTRNTGFDFIPAIHANRCCLQHESLSYGAFKMLSEAIDIAIYHRDSSNFFEKGINNIIDDDLLVEQIL